MFVGGYNKHHNNNGHMMVAFCATFNKYDQWLVNKLPMITIAITINLTLANNNKNDTHDDNFVDQREEY